MKNPKKENIVIKTKKTQKKKKKKKKEKTNKPFVFFYVKDIYQINPKQYQNKQ